MPIQKVERKKTKSEKKIREARICAARDNVLKQAYFRTYFHTSTLPGPT